MAGFLASRGNRAYSQQDLRQAVIQGSILASFTCEAFSTRRLEALGPHDLQHRIDEFRRITEW
jgi:hypothetical protein